MSSNYYQIYLNSVLQLAATIVIKSEDSANGLNTYVNDLASGGLAEPVNPLDPTTWKYYLNISGQYHPVDTMMTVTSMDTLQTINFTQENLVSNPATSVGYQYGTRAYQELITRYPAQEQLILGILYPCDLTTAIDAREGEILTIPPGLVQANEYTFQMKLQASIYGYKERWVNPAFNLSDPLYPAVNHGIMYLNLVMDILNIRMEACKTNEAHTFHVQSYLASHLGLDQYLPLMTTNQALWFYRNICYIERNIGQSQTFNLLLEHIMTERNLNLAEFLMEHDISTMPGVLDPVINFVRTPLNLGENDDGNNILSLTEMLNLEQPMARDNTLYQGDLEPEILSAMQYSRSSSLPTKALVSAMIDYSNSSPYILPDILLSHWLWLSSQGIYTAFVNITNEQTGDVIPLSALDAWTLMWYCWMMASGIDVSTIVIPTMFANRVQRIPTPTPATLLTVVDTTLVPLSTAQTALSLQPVFTEITSTQAFYNTCVDLTTAMNMQLNLIALQEHRDARAYVQGMVELIYSDNVCSTAPAGQTYPEWFAERNLNLSTFSTEDLNQMYLNILSLATGANLVDITTLASLQAGMVSMFATLSSYSVQFMSSINASNIRNVESPAVRVGNIASSVTTTVLMPESTVEIIGSKMHLTVTKDYDLNRPSMREWVETNYKQTVRVPLSARTYIPSNGLRWQETVQIGVSMTPTNPLPDNLPNGVIPVMGIDLWLALTPDQQADFIDMYGNSTYTYSQSTGIPLYRVITQTVLPGLTWPGVPITSAITTLDLDGFTPAK